MGDGGPLDGAVAAEGEPGLAVDVLRIPYVRAVVTLVYGHVYPGPFGMRLRGKKHKKAEKYSIEARDIIQTGMVFQIFQTSVVI